MPQSQDRVAVVTGSSSGLGLLSAVVLAQAGWRVVATMRDLTRQDRLLTEATKSKAESRITLKRCDVTSEDEVNAVVAEIEREFGRIDLLLNNAGFAMAGLAEDVSLEELRRQFETNFFGQVRMTKAVLPIMRRQRSGKILMMSSTSGVAAVPGIGAYSASKWALEGWSEALRMELLPLGVYVSLIEPGSHESDIWQRNTQIASRSYASENAERMKKFGEGTKKIPKEDPMNVARAVLKITQTDRPKLRYPVGRIAGKLAWIKLLLPWSRYERSVLKMTGLG